MPRRLPSFWGITAPFEAMGKWLRLCASTRRETEVFMSLQVCQSDSQKVSFGHDDELSATILKVLGACYVRESQHAMRYRQHAGRIHQPQFRQALLNISAEEKKHAESIGVQIQGLGGQIPEVIGVHVA